MPLNYEHLNNRFDERQNMATDKADKITGDLFTSDEKTQITAAMATYKAALERKAKAELNSAIRTLREEEVKTAAALLNKLQGL